MTVASSTDRATFTGNGVTQIFPLPFRFFANSDIQAWLVTNATGALTSLTLGTHYTLSGAGDPEVDGSATGVLTMLTAPTSLQSLFVQRVIPATQPTDIVNQGRFSPEIHEDVFDRLTMLIQQANSESKGAIRVAVGDPEPIRLPNAISRALQLMGFDSAGNPIAVAPASGSAADLALSLVNDTDPSKGSGQVGFFQAGAGAVGRTALAKMRERVSVLDFGAVGDGLANDTAAIQAAIAYAKLTKSAIYSDARLTHFLGTFPDSGDGTRFIIDFDGFHFETKGCKFTCNSSLDIAQAANANQSVFRFQDASDGYIGDFNVVASAVDRTNSIGVVAIHIRSNSANSKNLNFGAIRGSKLLSNITGSSANPASFRCRGVTVQHSYSENSYYNINCADNIDDFAGVVSSLDVVRSYFVYGVQGHGVKVYSRDHNKFTDILIKRYGFNTKGIRVSYHAINDLSADASVSIEHQNDTDDGIIEDVYIDLNVTKSNAANPTLNFVSFTDAGSIRSTTNAITNGVVVTGNSNSTTPTVIASGVSGVNNGENISRLNISRDLLAGLLDYKRYIMLDGSRRRMAISGATGGMTLRFNVSEFKFIPNIGLLTLYAADNATGSASEFICRNMWVSFSVSSTGLVTINSTQTIDQFLVGALGPTITIPSGLSTFEVAVTINNYTGANRRVRGTLDVYSAFEM